MSLYGVDPESVLLSDYDNLLVAETISTMAVIDWIAARSPLSKEVLLQQPLADLLEFPERLKDAATPTQEEQRDVKRWLRGRSKMTPRWVLCLTLAQGDPLRAWEIEQKTPLVWWQRGVVYRRGGPATGETTPPHEEPDGTIGMENNPDAVLDYILAQQGDAS